jgi:hypothetical protein
MISITCHGCLRHMEGAGSTLSSEGKPAGKMTKSLVPCETSKKGHLLPRQRPGGLRWPLWYLPS